MPSVNKNIRTAESFESGSPGGEWSSIEPERLFSALKKKIKFIIVCTIVCGIIGFCVNSYFIPPKYTSSATIFLTPIVNESTGTADYDSAMANEKLVSNVVSLMTENNIMTKVAEKTGVDDPEKIKDCITVTNQTDTEIIKVSAETYSPTLSKEIAETTVDVFMDTMQKNINVRNIEIVDTAHEDTKPSSPDIPRNTVLSALAGFLLSCVFVALKAVTDKKTRTKEEAEEYFNIPVYCVLPNTKKGRR